MKLKILSNIWKYKFNSGIPADRYCILTSNALNEEIVVSMIPEVFNLSTRASNIASRIMQYQKSLKHKNALNKYVCCSSAAALKQTELKSWIDAFNAKYGSIIEFEYTLVK